MNIVTIIMKRNLRSNVNFQSKVKSLQNISIQYLNCALYSIKYYQFVNKASLHSTLKGERKMNSHELINRN